MKLASARLESRSTVVLLFHHPPGPLERDAVTFVPPLEIRSVETHGTTVMVSVDGVDLTRNYTVLVRRLGNAPLVFAGVLNEFRSDKALGCTRENGMLVFRLFAPRASRVELMLFTDLDDELGSVDTMECDESGVWENALPDGIRERYYAYRIDGPTDVGESFDPSVPVADPYSTLVVARNSWQQEARSVIPPQQASFDWGDDAPVRIAPEDLVIYEAHVRDMSAHPSAGASVETAGTYAGLAEHRAAGSVEWLRALGINAVELLPVQHYASVEPPFGVRSTAHVYNTWNPYAANHWGYMTSYYFAPEPRYCAAAVTRPGAWNDCGTAHCDEFRRMVRAFHTAGIAVILDVVYNHASQYNQQPLKLTDRQYYFRRDERGAYSDASGCGNDMETARPMARRLIVDSILHWMREFHVDGFRFDLATMIDTETMREIRTRTREINPDVILIAEPWGGGRYDLASFSHLGIAAWNDIFRNGVKGSDPQHGRGYIFGSWGGSTPHDFGKWVCGSVHTDGGPFLEAGHAVNYLEAHDGYTLGDFVRIALGVRGPRERVKDVDAHASLGPSELRVHKLAAMMLLVSRGAVMLHAGQEFARGKVIADRGMAGTTPGLMDHNSYEKDDETNWLNWEHATRNAELVDYYRGMIAIRRSFPELRGHNAAVLRFLIPDAHVASGFTVAAGGGSEDVAVLVNANHEREAVYDLPDEGPWFVLADARQAGVTPLASVTGHRFTVPPATGLLLVRKERFEAAFSLRA
jgi:pullulanase